MAVLFTIIAVSVAGIAPGATAQVVEGVVVAEDGGAPVGRASLLLVDSAYVRQALARTDSRGRYRLEAPQPGSYFLLLERPGHANVLSPLLTLEAGQVLQFRMVVESRTVEQMAALGDLRVRRDEFTRRILDQCETGPVEAGSAVLTGVVRDSTSGVGLPGLGVVIEWDPEGPLHRAETRTRSDGNYTVCDIPAGERITLRVLELDGGARLAALVLEAGVVHVLDLPVDVSSLATVTSVGQIVGRVWDEVGEPVSDAEVGIEGVRITAVTNERGFFAFDSVPRGRRVLTIEHLGYGTQERELVVRGSRTHDVEVRLVTRPIELAPITVTVRPRWWYGDMVDLQHRMDLGFGHFLTREDLDQQQSRLGWALSGLPGVDVVGGSFGTLVRFRRAPGLNCGFPVIYLDGVKYQPGPRGLDEFHTSEIEVVELYAGPAQVPGQFGGSDAECGVVVIWTRRPGF